VLIDYETKASYDLIITTTSSSNLSYSDDFIVAVVNVLEGMSKTLSGTSGNDLFNGFTGYDVINGGEGIDKISYVETSDNCTFLLNVDNQLVVYDHLTQRDVISEIERIAFSDSTYVLESDSSVSDAAKAIIATFGSEGLGTYMSAALFLVDEGTSLDSLCDLVIDNSYIENLVGSTSNSSFVDHVYENIFGILPGPADHGKYTALLDNGTYTKSTLLALAANTTLTADIMTANLVDLIGVPGSADGQILALQYD